MSDQLTFVDYLQRVKSGLETWKEKPHNAKWWKRIDGTPIPNDLCVCIAEALARPPSTSKRATPPACHAMITPETSCEIPKGHSGEHSGATQESREPHETAGQILADDILKRIAKRYENCNLNIYPDMPHLTPVEAVLRCAMEEGFVLRAASPSSGLRTWIAGAQFMVTPKEAPDGNAPLHVVTVEGLLKWLDERERA